MRDTMEHRGPDDAGVWVSADGLIGLAHRRLSVIDLSPAGHQPMTSVCGQYRIVFNGEIYNYIELRATLMAKGHKFRSNSDTEVILASYREWGTDCVRQLAGMFGLAIFDSTNRTLFLARDRVGEKPLFYSWSKETFAFGSELKSLLAPNLSQRRINLTALDHYLAYGYVSGVDCLIAGVNRLQPAHALVYNIGEDDVRIWRYWSLPRAFSGSQANTNDLADELQSRLEAAVKRQMVADVPVGILLSGGIDSSLVAAIAARAASRPIQTYTVAFSGHDSNEGPHARRVAEHIGAHHTELSATPDDTDLLPSIIRQFDEPVGDSSIIPTYLLSRLVRRHCTVALGGDGGDELFGGYAVYSAIIRNIELRRHLPAIASSAIARVARALPMTTRGRTTGLSMGLSQVQVVARAGLLLDQAARDRFVPALRALSDPRAEANREAAAKQGETLVQQLTAADFATYLPDDVLTKVDRASMLASLEVRAPLLDQSVVEFAFGQVPDELRAIGRNRKILLRRLARRLLPADFDVRRKQGFELPLQAWFQTRWGDELLSHLADAGNSPLERPAAESILQRRMGSNPTNNRRIFSLAMLNAWCQAYGATL
jgi:asparagine synthase (glutamine-hydrolysing)